MATRDLGVHEKDQSGREDCMRCSTLQNMEAILPESGCLVLCPQYLTLCPQAADFYEHTWDKKKAGFFSLY